MAARNEEVYKLYYATSERLQRLMNCEHFSLEHCKSCIISAWPKIIQHQECQTLAYPVVFVFRPFIKENLAFSDQKSYFEHQIDYLSALGCYIFDTRRVGTPTSHIVAIFISDLNGQKGQKWGHDHKWGQYIYSMHFGQVMTKIILLVPKC